MAFVGGRLERLSDYEAFAVIDDVFFKDFKQREAVVSQEAWRSLAMAVENHPETCTWYVIRHLPRGSRLNLPELVRLPGSRTPIYLLYCKGSCVCAALASRLGDNCYFTSCCCYCCCISQAFSVSAQAWSECHTSVD